MSRNSKNGSTSRWRALRARKLAASPICEICGTAPACEVDHIVQLCDQPALRFAWPNLRSTCGPCHKRRHNQRPRYPIDPVTGITTDPEHHWNKPPALPRGGAAR